MTLPRFIVAFVVGWAIGMTLTLLLMGRPS